MSASSTSPRLRVSSGSRIQPRSNSSELSCLRGAAEELGEGDVARLAWTQVEAGEDVDEVAAHEVGGALARRRGYRLDQLMVGVALADGVAAMPIEGDYQRRSRHQLADEAGKDRL